MSNPEKLDWIVIGGGPSGLACAIEARKLGLSCLVIERGCVVNSIYHYPISMIFFTTAELLEIGEVPMIVSSPKPTREDGLRYYRRVINHFRLPIRDYEEVLEVDGFEGDFKVSTRDRRGVERDYSCSRIIVSTGYYDNPNLLGIPGEGRPKVSHYYSEPHPYFQKKVAVVGGSNSAAEAALELYRNGVQVTLIHRGKEMSRSVKYWVRPDINNRIDRGEIEAHFESRLVEIGEREISVETPSGALVLENDFVLALVGYHPDASFLESMGIEVDEETMAPRHDPKTLESNVAGIYVAGSIVAGKMTNRIFIENGRFHGEQIFASLADAAGNVERAERTG